MNTYSLTREDVYSWKTELYNSDLQTQRREQAMIGLSLVNWATVRFSLMPSQVTYLNALPPEFIKILQADLIEAINHHFDIILEKEIRPFSNGSGPEDSVKVTETRKKAAASASYQPEGSDPLPLGSDSTMNGELVVRIYYKDA
ncbi:hypothetical protein [Sphingobacterium wenxiniae]|uniref:Uncharacterized protein n=1 Tax=Sphingobacterium wenxiniae TaxID=683125 RepID=A0A1I6QAE6_9SPHI|nr:hypothetical protein [Sphingobacterium wenxiniae]SFS49325.1 hypothetical protein SAMN05660206_102221 [Sphingobacterium wenxiniae]